MRRASRVEISLGFMPRMRGCVRVDRVVHQLAVARLEAGIVEAEARREAAEDLGVGQRLADRRDHGLGALQPVVAVGGIDVVAFEMRRRRQHDVAVLHALGHGDLDADEEHVLAREAALHAVLVRMHDDRVVIVDEQRAQRRIDVVARQMPADVHDVQRARAGRQQVRPRAASPGVFGKALPAPEHDAVAARRACPSAPAARSRRARRCRRCGRAPARCRAPAPADRPPPSSAASVRMSLGRHAAHLGGPLDRPFARQRHELVVAEHVALR